MVLNRFPTMGRRKRALSALNRMYGIVRAPITMARRMSRSRQ